MVARDDCPEALPGKPRAMHRKPERRWALLSWPFQAENQNAQQKHVRRFHLCLPFKGAPSSPDPG
jgi:hypothetical protein